MLDYLRDLSVKIKVARVPSDDKSPMQKEAIKLGYIQKAGHDNHLELTNIGKLFLIKNQS